MGIHQKESKTTKSIWEAKTIYDTAFREAKTACAHFIQEAKTHCPMAIKEAKATCAHTIQKAKTLCSMSIRDAEAQELPRMALFKKHMPHPSCTWKSKLLRRRTRFSLTSSLPVRLLYEPALQNSTVC